MASGATDFTGSKPLTGSQSVSPAAITSYTIVCANNAGATVTRNATLTVTQVPPALSVSPNFLQFQLGGAGCTATGSRTFAVSSNQSVSLSVNTTYATLSVSSLPAGQNQQVSVSPGNTAGVASVTVTSGGETKTVTLQFDACVSQPACPTTGINYSPPGGTAYVNRNTTVSLNPISPWPSNCQVIWGTNKPSVLKVLGADAVYQICDASGNNCTWYYAGKNAVITGVYPGTADITAQVITIGTDGKWRIVSGGSVSHTWTVTNPPSAGLLAEDMSLPRYHDLGYVSQVIIR